MIFHLSELFRKYRAWCPNSDARPLRTAPPVLATPPVTHNPAQPGGGAGGSGRIDHGIKLTIGSIRLLVRNRQLLWFSLLTGLVMIFSLVSGLSLQFISGTALFPGTGLATGPASVMISHGSLPWIALTFIIGLVGTFLTYYLLAALIACVSLIHSGRAATVRDGLAHAGQYRWPLFSWAMIWACIGVVFSFFMNPSTMGSVLVNFGIIYGSMAFMACLYVLTLFVVPLLVLDNNDIVTAVTGSLSLFRKVWAEILVCFIIYFLIVFVVMLICLVPMIAIGFSGSASAAVAVVVAYMLVMLILLFIGSTIVGITITGLYLYGKTGTLPAMFEGKPVVQAPV
ncbi:MAG: DUF6159 family protein [Methanoregula sp.]|uniref:DUF6159 family protein n=1 Tax=Methanoregula sp. TaxID=2052170 RepID=UPI0025F17C42|nr:DUF6159 family protein [Methanoregula sp.]MCK9630412.1 DUF6159 family protein [Methanoregula sp.]